MSDELVVVQTSRDFDRIDFIDRYGAECSVQKSSLAFEDCIWLGVNDASPKILASQAAAHGVATTETTGWVPYPLPEAVLCRTLMHLTQEMVAKLIPVLQHFVDTGEISEADSAETESGSPAFASNWPGNETDEEIEAAVAEIRRPPAPTLEEREALSARFQDVVGGIASRDLADLVFQLGYRRVADEE
jgi:hypothetical protein